MAQNAPKKSQRSSTLSHFFQLFRAGLFGRICMTKKRSTNGGSFLGQYQPTHPILVSHILGNIAGKEESYKPRSELLQEKCILPVHSL